MTDVCICRTIALSGWDTVQQAVNPTCPVHATYTATEVKVLTEAVLRLGRKEAGEEIADALVKAGDERSKDRHHKDEELRDHGSTRYAAYLDAATIARNLASLASGAVSDASSGVPEGPRLSEEPT